MRSSIPLLVLAVLLAPPLAAAASPEGGAPEFAICPAHPLSFPANPFPPTSAAGELYTGATDAVNGVWVPAIGGYCAVVQAVVVIVNGVCNAEIGQDCV